MENVGAECYERGEGGVCWWEGDLETQDCGGVGSFPYEYYAGPQRGIARCEAHEHAVWTSVLETREFDEQMLFPHSGEGG